MLEHFEGTEMLCVSFERKNYPPMYTSDRAVLLNRDDEIVADFNQVGGYLVSQSPSLSVH